MDDDDKKPEDEPAEPARDAAQDEGAKLRVVSEEELKQILAGHETWLETDGKEGKQAGLSRTDLFCANLQGADLAGANLQGADLLQANLQGALLQGAKLQGADLRFANLQGADLTGANLQGAVLWFAKLQGADLTDANLTKAIGLTQEQLDEACGDDKTKLPDDLADYKMKPCPTPE